MLYVENLRDIDATTWNRLLAESPGGGHALQSYAWGAFKSTQGWRPLRLALKDDEKVLGVGQLLLRDMAGTTGAVAYCAKGPWIDWSSPEQVATMLEGMEHFARRQGAFVLKVESELSSGPGQPSERFPSVEGGLHRAIEVGRRLRQKSKHAGQNGHSAPEAGEEDKRVDEARAAILTAREAQAEDGYTAGRQAFADRGYVRSHWDMQFRTTMVLDLDRTPDEMLARMKNKWRYNVNLAQRKGVTIEEDNSLAARAELYDMYVHTAQRDGFMARPRSYFEGAWEAMISAGQGHLFFAKHEGKPLAALLAFTFGKKVWYQVGASRTEGRQLMPAHALQFHVMKWAYEQGLTYYDLVAIPNYETVSTSDSMWGLYVFKSGFGGRAIEWAGSFDKVLDPRGYAWEALEPAYFRLYKWRAKDILY